MIYCSRALGIRTIKTCNERVQYGGGDCSGPWPRARRSRYCARVKFYCFFFSLSFLSLRSVRACLCIRGRTKSKFVFMQHITEKLKKKKKTRSWLIDRRRRFLGRGRGRLVVVVVVVVGGRSYYENGRRCAPVRKLKTNDRVWI